MPNNYNNPQGRQNREDEIQYQRERAAANSGTANGLLIGGLLVALTGLGALVAYYWMKPAPTPTTIINTPNPTASVSPAPQKTTIIDRTVEKTAPPQIKVVEVEKPVIVPAPAAPPKIVEVPKPVIVPGATKVIEVPKPFAVPATPSTTDKSATPKASTTPAAKPAPAASDAEPTISPAPSTPEGGTN
jgi:hypothetical protein